LGSQHAHPRRQRKNIEVGPPDGPIIFGPSEFCAILSLAIELTMENSIGSRSASLAWKLALLLPLAPAVVLQLISQRQTDLRAGVKISMIGNIFLCVSMITQSLYLMRKSTKWGIMLLIFSGVVLGFGLHVVLRSL
jgi:hypothetical protein